MQANTEHFTKIYDSLQRLMYFLHHIQMIYTSSCSQAALLSFLGDEYLRSWPHV